VTRHRVETTAEADRVGFRGSPSILVESIDPFAGADTDTGADTDAAAGAGVGVSCRLYHAGRPGRGSEPDRLRAVIADA